MSQRFECSSIDGDDRYNDTGEEKRGQLVDILHSYKNHHSHQTEADGTVDSHVVQHGTVSPVWVCGVKYGSLGHQIFLKENKSNTLHL